MSTNRHERSGKVQTVLGLVDAEDLGITSTHEHLLINMTVYFAEPKEARFIKLAHEPVERLANDPAAPQNISWLQHNSYEVLDNLRLLDEALAIEEVMQFKKEGGSTIVEVSNVGLGRDPLGLVRISRTTGLNVVMGSGYYIGLAQDPEFDSKTEEQIAEEIIADIEVGVDNTGVRAGIIGEIGASWPLSDKERKSLLAAAGAHRHTGAVIIIHQVGQEANGALEIVKTLDKAGVDISRVIMCHIDLRIHPSSARLELAKTGCYLEYDLFGGHIFGNPRLGVFNRPCDRERIEQIIELIDAGYLKQILMAQDICLKSKLLRYGGHGYAHILRNMVPQMLLRGVTREQIHTILVENPKRLLQFP